ncbi:MAG: hypothetical protein ABIJ97_14805 [Bacteroidota bacterium]
MNKSIKIIDSQVVNSEKIHTSTPFNLSDFKDSIEFLMALRFEFLPFDILGENIEVIHL